MGNEKRRLLEPTSTFDRILYAGITLTGPMTANACFRNDDLHFAGVVFSLWSLVATAYTIEWAILSYRKWRNGNLPTHKSGIR